VLYSRSDKYYGLVKKLRDFRDVCVGGRHFAAEPSQCANHLLTIFSRENGINWE